MNDKQMNDQFFAYIGYMLTSAQGLLHEPQDYGPFRLLEGVSRLCSMLENKETQYGDFFTVLKEEVDKNKFLIMTDMDTFVKSIDEAIVIYVRKAKEIGMG